MEVYSKIMTIKEIYGCKYINSKDELFPLQKWYNMLIDKNVEELSIADVLRMIRQNEFVEIAISKSIDILMQNTLAGELYEGELLEHISHICDKMIDKYSNALKQIVSNGWVQIEEYDWITENEREEFKKLLINFEQRLENLQCENKANKQCDI